MSNSHIDQIFETSLPQAVKQFIVLELLVTACCIVAELICRRILHLHFPYSWPLAERGDPFRDFYLYRPRYAFFHSPSFFTFDGPGYMYPAPLALVYRIFYFFPHSTQVFLGFILAGFAAAAALFGQALIAKGISRAQVVALIALTIACSYGPMLEFQTANMEFIVWLFVSFGMWMFLKGRGISAAACFGIAGAMKIFPFVFLGLFLARKQYREIVISLVISAITTVTGLWLLCPDIAVSYRGTRNGLLLFREQYMLAYNQVGFDHSLFALPKAVLGVTKFITHSSTPPGHAVLAPMLSIYLPLVALVGVVLYFTMIRRLPVVNQVICLTVASVLLPPVSYDYTLIHLYGPWVLLVLFAVETRGRNSAGLIAAFACFAFLLSPESEFIYHAHRMGGQTKAIALVVLMIVALRHRFASSFDVEPQPAHTL